MPGEMWFSVHVGMLKKLGSIFINRVAATTATVAIEVVTRSMDSRQDVKVRRQRAKAFSSQFLKSGPLLL